jgi:hypothetical protein
MRWRTIWLSCVFPITVFSIQPPVSTKITQIPEVKAARTNLYDLVARGKHLSLAAAQPYLRAEADKRVLRDFMKTVPSERSIKFLRTNNFAGFSFKLDQFNDIQAFFYDRNGPDHEFLDPELETARKKFRDSCQALLAALGEYTFSTDRGFQSIPAEWEEDQPERFDCATNKIHTAAETVWRALKKVIEERLLKSAIDQKLVASTRPPRHPTVSTRYLRAARTNF